MENVAEEVPTRTVGDIQPIAIQSFPFWRTPWEFAVHGVIGTLIFAIIAALAVVLDLAVRWLTSYRISMVVILGLEAAEYAILMADLFLFAVFLYRTTKRTLKDL